MEEKLVVALSQGLCPCNTLVENATRFWSNAKAPLHMLSNFYACPCKVAGYTFPSAEHAYQALQKMSDNIKDWTTEGIYSKWGKVYRIVNQYRTKRGGKELKPGPWKRKNQIGILAKLVITHSKAFGLSWKAQDDTLRISYENRWRPIFESKYSDPILRRVLSGTRGPLIEFKRGGHKAILKAFNTNLAADVTAAEANKAAHKVELWGAFNYEMSLKRNKVAVDVPKSLRMTVWGQNVTGKNLTRYRDEMIARQQSLTRKRAADTDEASAAPSSKRGKPSVSTQYIVERVLGGTMHMSGHVWIWVLLGADFMQMLLSLGVSVNVPCFVVSVCLLVL